MEEKEILANNLVNYRKASGLSQLELAKKLNYSNKNISKWEKGETMPNVFILQKIANIYGIPLENLLTENAPEPAKQESLEIKKAKIRKTIFKVFMLVLANAILYSVGTALVYTLNLTNVAGFNIWLVYLYLAPLSFLSINIYLRVVYKFVDIISLSFFGWLICLSFYLTFISAPKIELIFILGGAYEGIVACIAVLVNIKLLPKKQKNKK